MPPHGVWNSIAISAYVILIRYPTNVFLRNYNLLEYGITGKAWKWFEAYLRPHYQMQCVKTGGSYSVSEQCNVLSGVPQGSVLGPLLFVILINDLSECICSATPFIFADDTKFLHIIRSIVDTKKLQADINNASNWSITSDLFFNESKFFHLLFLYNRFSNLHH